MSANKAIVGVFAYLDDTLKAVEAVKEKGLAFVTIDPFLIYPDYQADLSDADVEVLQLRSAEEAFLLSVVNIRHNTGEGITANLVSPIVINHVKLIAKQVILKNHTDYSVRFRIDQG